MKLQTIDPEICSIFIFQERIWEQFLHSILCIIFQQKCFSCYILLTDQILLSYCVYFLRYCVICVLQLFLSCIIITKLYIKPNIKMVVNGFQQKTTIGNMVYEKTQVPDKMFGLNYLFAFFFFCLIILIIAISVYQDDFLGDICMFSAIWSQRRVFENVKW